MHTIGHLCYDPASIQAALKRETRPKKAEVTQTAPLNTHSVSVSSDESQTRGSCWFKSWKIF